MNSTKPGELPTIRTIRTSDRTDEPGPAERRAAMVAYLRGEFGSRAERVLNGVLVTPRELFAARFTARTADGTSVSYDQLGPDDDEGLRRRLDAWRALYDYEVSAVTRWADDGTLRMVLPSVADTVRLLTTADIGPFGRVLHVGTGTGYTAAVIANMLRNAEHLTTVDCDAEALVTARRALGEAGTAPGLARVVHRDGRAMLDHGSVECLVSSCDTVRIPGTWLRGMSEGGSITTTAGGRLITLRVSLGRAEGRFSSVPALGDVAPLRVPDAPSTAPLLAELAALARRGGAKQKVGAPAEGIDFGHPTLRWLLRLVMPEIVIHDHDGAYVLLDTVHQSWARTTADSSTILVGGRRRDLWSAVLTVWSGWIAGDRPDPDAYGLTVRPDGHHVLWLNDNRNPVAALPHTRGS